MTDRAESVGVIGRERALMEGLAKLVHAAVKKRHDYGKLRETRRGYQFEVHLRDPDDQPTGRIARVTVELDRVEDVQPNDGSPDG